jgi:hypothetical protein
MVKHEMAMKRPVEFIIPSYLEVLDDANVHCADEAIVKLTGKRPASKFYWKFGLSPIAVVAPVVISVVMLSVVVVSFTNNATRCRKHECGQDRPQQHSSHY